ncbi:uncharacterized protein LOC134772527 [Penaeus indicus]|uniref:uncharacterized protein LOC134772527 n=1 Tax=Penaeus indicus TaxID=29960 RepID=UPI00300CA0E4
MVQCSVPNCNHKSESHNYSFYQFPKEERSGLRCGEPWHLYTSSLTPCHPQAESVVRKAWRRKHWLSPIRRQGVRADQIRIVNRAKEERKIRLLDISLGIPGSLKTMDKMGDFIPMDDVIAGMASDFGGDIFLDQNMMSHSFDDINSFRLAQEVSRIGSTQYNMGQRNRLFQSTGNNNAMFPSQNRQTAMDYAGNSQPPWNVQFQTRPLGNSRRPPDQAGSHPHAAAPSLVGFDFDGGNSRRMHAMPPLHPEFMPEQREQAADRAPRPKSGRKKRQQHASK